MYPPVQNLVLPVSELLRTCPTEEEILEIRHDFNITFDRAVTDDRTFWNPTCNPGAIEQAPITNLYNMFRVMKHLQFTESIPLLESTNIYDWLRGVSEIRFFYGGPTEYSSGAAGHLSIRADLFQQPSVRHWANRDGSSGLMHLVGLVVHEGWHAKTDIGHVACTPTGTVSEDRSLEYGGAWAAQHWYFRWLAEKTWTYLNPDEKQIARTSAVLAASRFCTISPSLQTWLDANSR